MKEDKIHSGPNGLEVWICNDPSVTQPFLEVSMGCFRFHMNLETLNFLLEGLSKAFMKFTKTIMLIVTVVLMMEHYMENWSLRYDTR